MNAHAVCRYSVNVYVNATLVANLREWKAFVLTGATFRDDKVRSINMHDAGRVTSAVDSVSVPQVGRGVMCYAKLMLTDLLCVQSSPIRLRLGWFL